MSSKIKKYVVCYIYGEIGETTGEFNADVSWVKSPNKFSFEWTHNIDEAYLWDSEENAQCVIPVARAEVSNQFVAVVAVNCEKFVEFTS